MEPLTPAEVAFNRESSPDLRKLPSYCMSFTPSVLGEPSQMLFLQLRNSGDLPTSFSIHMPNERSAAARGQAGHVQAGGGGEEKPQQDVNRETDDFTHPLSCHACIRSLHACLREIELEHWADEGEPTEEEVLHKAVIDEIKCFELYPKLGSLLPGETLTLSMAYHYRSMVQIPLMAQVAAAAGSR